MPRHELICFDVDGTLITHPTGKVIWEVLNLRFTGDDSVNQERYRMYREGEISYADWVELDVQGWIDAGATHEQVVDCVQGFEVHPGAWEAIHAFKDRGAALALISGTLDVVIDTHFPDHPFDDVFCNGLRFDADGMLDGWRATPFDLQGKPDALRQLAEKHGVDLDRTAFIGDGENDVPVIGVAGTVVAFNPRSEELERGADHVLRDVNMTRLLDILE